MRRLSSPSRVCSQVFSSGASHLAISGRSVIAARTQNAHNTAGTASRMKIHCQPLNPSTPFMPRIAPEMIEASALATGCAMNKVEITRPRYSGGNQ